jgi:hypothetical protein
MLVVDGGWSKRRNSNAAGCTSRKIRAELNLISLPREEFGGAVKYSRAFAISRPIKSINLKSL